MTEKTIDEQLSGLHQEVDEVTRGERFYSKQFATLYNKVRKSLVLLNKARKNKYEGGSKGIKGKLVKEAPLTNQEAYEKAKEVLRNLIVEE